jgi:hypothetical protein
LGVLHQENLKNRCSNIFAVATRKNITVSKELQDDDRIRLVVRIYNISQLLEYLQALAFGHDTASSSSSRRPGLGVVQATGNIPHSQHIVYNLVEPSLLSNKPKFGRRTPKLNVDSSFGSSMENNFTPYGWPHNIQLETM